jgi:hypothetical protein
MTDQVLAAPAAPAPGVPATSAAPAGPWFSGFTDPAVAAHATTKNWATQEDAVRSHLNLEKLIGVPQDQLLKLPKSDAAPEEWNPIYDRLGRPKTADEYKLEVPPGADAEYTKHVAKIMHEQGLTVKQAQAVVKGESEFIAKAVAAQTEVSRVAAVAEKLSLDKEWGAAGEKNYQIARAAAKTFGITGEQIDDLQDSMGFKATMLFLHNLGSKIGEDGFVAASGGGAFNGALTPAQAQARIAALKGDKEYVKKFLAGDVGAKNEMRALHEMAYQE